MEAQNLLINKPILIEIADENENWKEFYKCRADVRTVSANENVSSSAVQSNTTTMFTIRYSKKASEIEFKTQDYRIKFRGAVFDIDSCDNDKFKNALLILKAVGRKNG